MATHTQLSRNNHKRALLFTKKRLFAGNWLPSRGSALARRKAKRGCFSASPRVEAGLGVLRPAAAQRLCPPPWAMVPSPRQATGSGHGSSLHRVDTAQLGLRLCPAPWGSHSAAGTTSLRRRRPCRTDWTCRDAGAAPHQGVVSLNKAWRFNRSQHGAVDGGGGAMLG